MKNPLDLLPPEAWATYIIGISAIIAGIYQLNKNFRLQKRSQVFNELASDILDAKVLVEDISSKTKEVIEQLAKAANNANFDTTGKEQKDIDAEVKRRLSEIEVTATKQGDALTSAYEGYKQILILIRKIEKNTLIDDKPREAARYLFYAATEQLDFVGKINDVLISLRVTPDLGTLPNISSATFNSFVQIVHVALSKNTLIGNYLNDLEVILHNSLVKGIYGKAKNETQPAVHLTLNGYTDKRVKQSLL